MGDHGAHRCALDDLNEKVQISVMTTELPLLPGRPDEPRARAERGSAG
ncbi:hypothetical protein [Streptomyces sp. NPDC048473]